MAKYEKIEPETTIGCNYSNWYGSSTVCNRIDSEYRIASHNAYAVKDKSTDKSTDNQKNCSQSDTAKDDVSQWVVQISH